MDRVPVLHETATAPTPLPVLQPAFRRQSRIYWRRVGRAGKRRRRHDGNTTALASVFRDLAVRYTARPLWRSITHAPGMVENRRGGAHPARFAVIHESPAERVIGSQRSTGVATIDAREGPAMASISASTNQCGVIGASPLQVDDDVLRRSSPPTWAARRRSVRCHWRQASAVITTCGAEAPRPPRRSFRHLWPPDRHPVGPRQRPRGRHPNCAGSGF